MCRLLAITGKKEDIAPAVFYDFMALAKQGRVPTPRAEKGHHDGWGFVVIAKGRPFYLGRSPRNVLEDPSVETAIDLACHTDSPVLLGHLRKTSGTKPALDNTHPFMRDGWIFCHNGTVFNHDRLPLKKFSPEGETDSETIFLFLLDRIGKKKGPEAVPKLMAGVRDLRASVEFSSLNFLLSDGRVLCAYREYNPQCRRGGYKSARELVVYYTLYYSRLPWGTVICSEPLAVSERWAPFQNRELRVCNLTRGTWTSKKSV